MSIWGIKSASSPRVQDVDRLTDLYQSYFHLVWRALQAAGVRAADLDDLTHDVFLVVRRKLLTSDPVPFSPGMSTLEYERAWSSWLTGVAFHQAKNYRTRASHRRQELMDNDDDVVDQRDEAGRCEERELLILLLSTTAPKRRAVFMLVELEGYTIQEVASILEIPHTTAAKRLREAQADVKETAAMLKRREEANRPPRKSGAYLLPFGTGAWVKKRALLNPPEGTAERVWERIQASIAQMEEQERLSNSPRSQPLVPPPVSQPRSLGGLWKSVLGHLLSAGLGAAIAVWLLWPRPSARIAVLQMPIPIPIASRSTQTSTTQATMTTVLNVADLPFVTSLVGATPPEHAKFDPEEVRMITVAHVAYTSGDLAETIAALNAYNAQYPEGQFKMDARALLTQAQPYP